MTESTSLPSPARVRDIDLTTFTRAQLDDLEAQPGPLRRRVREELLRRGDAPDAPQPTGETAGEIALSLLTDEQRGQVDAQLAKRSAAAAVETAAASLDEAVTNVAKAVGQAREAITAAPDDVDVAVLSEKVAALTPILPTRQDQERGP